ncbi:hypothetical protein ACH5RR_037565 [Cinchona calisaya]|uniref:Rab3-GAP regulatory subunit N-terminal domain-containing protein n=1 Tax=Cinchona calisaya TaxID=153742 RepID=A0ABD2Y7Z4_9GENT
MRRDPEDSGTSFGRLPCQLWNVSKYVSCTDAAITCIMPPPLMELQVSHEMWSFFCSIFPEFAFFAEGASAIERYYSFLLVDFWKLSEITTGDDAVISAYRLVCFDIYYKDYPRKGEKLILFPSGTLAAITDSLGRILLLDSWALIVVQPWKGYRDASCLFVEILVKKNSATIRSPGYEYEKSDYCLCLAIHAPGKGISREVEFVLDSQAAIPLKSKGSIEESTQEGRLLVNDDGGVVNAIAAGYGRDGLE